MKDLLILLLLFIAIYSFLEFLNRRRKAKIASNKKKILSIAMEIGYNPRRVLFIESEGDYFEVVFSDGCKLELHKTEDISEYKRDMENFYFNLNTPSPSPSQ